MTRRQRNAKAAAEHRHMRDRVLRHYDSASGAIREAGRAWYPSAESAIATLADAYAIGRPNAAGVVAALSPQTRWRKNLEGAEAVLEGEPNRATGYGANVRKATLIANGGCPLTILGGDKVRAFWANLIGSRTTLTIDVWAQRAATGDRPRSRATQECALSARGRCLLVGRRDGGRVPARLAGNRMACDPPGGRTRPRHPAPTKIGGVMKDNELSRASQISLDRAANGAAIQDRAAAMQGCGQCGNPHPGTLIEGICADCQKDNQLSMFDAKRSPYDAAHGLDGDPGGSLYR